MVNEAESRGLLGQDDPDVDADLDLYEVNTYSFVLKIWLESSAREGQPAEWRGEIVEVLGKQGNYFHSLREMIDLLSPYLEKLGIEDSLCRPPQNG